VLNSNAGSFYTLPDGQKIPGTVNDDGSFLSQDGTVYVTGTGEKAGDGTVIAAGTVQHGVTTPDGTFLPGGVEHHLPDGRTLYGYTAGSDFWSYDGSTAVVGGRLITGALNFDDGVFTTSDGAYLVSDKGLIKGVQPPGQDFLPNGERRIIEGKPVYGTVGDDGSFLSQDGTVYVTGTGEKAGDGTVIAAGTVQHGVTTPDGYFLPGGSIHTLPGGKELYGYAMGSGFVSSDGKTVVLPSGQVLTGTSDNETGIFTASDGKTYYVGSGDSIQSAALQLDGSYLLANQQTVMTSASWTVDLLQLDQSIDLVSSRIQPISDEIEAIQQQFSIIEASWSSPAGGAFADITSQAAAAFATLKDLLSDTVDKMRLSYTNYEKSELQNVRNTTGNP
jgi:hypothetical protein